MKNLACLFNINVFTSCENGDVGQNSGRYVSNLTGSHRFNPSNEVREIDIPLFDIAVSEKGSGVPFHFRVVGFTKRTFIFIMEKSSNTFSSLQALLLILKLGCGTTLMSYQLSELKNNTKG